MKNPYILSLPIVLATITGILATDLYLPAVPLLHSALGGTPVQAQYTLASFMAAFAIGQLIVGSIGDRFETRTIMIWSFTALTAVSLACAVVGTMPQLIALRALQGFAAAAGMALAPAMVRELGDEATTIKVIGFMASIQAIIPAVAPAAGVWLIAALGWESSFYGVALASLASVIVFASMRRVRKPRLADEHRNPVVVYLRMLGTRRFMALTLGHALGVGSLVTFVFAAPYMLTQMFGRPVDSFAWMQIFLVGSFMISVNLASRMTQTLGVETTIVTGGLVQVAGGLAFLGLTVCNDAPSTVAMTLAMIPVNTGLGLRAGATFTRAMDASGAPDGSTGALMMFLIAVVISAGTSAVTPFLHVGPVAVGLGVAVQVVLSMMALVVGLASGSRVRAQVA